MKLKTIAVGSLYVATAIGATIYFASMASAQTAQSAEISSPALILSDISDQSRHSIPPEGVPPELHRKVLHLYKRIHNAYPDASRKRVFLKIADELGIHPRRLWNAYHPNDRGGPDVRPVDVVRDRQIDRVRDRQVDRVRDHSLRTDRVRNDRLVRDRPQRDRPRRN